MARRCRGMVADKPSWLISDSRRLPPDCVNRLWNTATVIKLSILIIMVCLHKYITSGCFTRDVMAHFTDVK